MSEQMAAVDAAIATLSGVTRTLDQQVRARDAEIKDLREDIADRNQKILAQAAEIDELKRLLGSPTNPGQNPAGPSGMGFAGSFGYPDTFLPRFRELGATVLRAWQSVSKGNRIRAGTFTNMRRWIGHGLICLMTIHPSGLDGLDAADVRQCGRDVAEHAPQGAIIGFGNEPDIGNEFWRSEDVKRFIDEQYGPWAEEVRSRRPDIILVAPSLGRMNKLATNVPILLAALERWPWDRIDIHCYGNALRFIDENLAHYNRVPREKRVMTEGQFGLKGQQNASQIASWRKHVAETYIRFARFCGIAAVYRATNQNKTGFEQVVPMEEDGTPTEFFNDHKVAFTAARLALAA